MLRYNALFAFKINVNIIAELTASTATAFSTIALPFKKVGTMMHNFSLKMHTAYRRDVYFADDRLQNVRVTIGESEDKVSGTENRYLCGYIPGQPPGDVFTVTCTERMYGRFVRVTAVEINEMLNIQELQVYGW